MLIRRNLLLFFKDRAQVFFSLLVVLINIMLFVLFLGNTMEDSFRAIVGDVEGLGAAVAGIALAGMIALTSMSTSMGAMTTNITDKESGKIRDFLSSPYSRWKLLLSYTVSSSLIGILMSFAGILLSIVYLLSIGGEIPNIFLLILTTVLSVLCANSILFFITIFVKSQGAFSAFISVISTLSGFLMGIYVPIDILPESVQWVVRLFPMSHSAAMFRTIFAQDALEKIFSDLPSAYLENVKESIGLVFNYNGFISNFWFSAGVLLVTIIVFYGLGLLAVTKGKSFV